MAATLGAIPRYMRPKESQLVRDRAITKTERMRQYLREHGPATSATLAMEADVPTCALVGALLKGDLARGSVAREGGRYAWNPEWDDQVAAELRDALRVELDRLERHAPACTTCLYLDAAKSCLKFEARPPAEFLSVGCEQWVYDEVPF